MINVNINCTVLRCVVRMDIWINLETSTFGALDLTKQLTK